MGLGVSGDGVSSTSGAGVTGTSVFTAAGASVSGGADGSTSSGVGVSAGVGAGVGAGVASDSPVAGDDVASSDCAIAGTGRFATSSVARTNTCCQRSRIDEARLRVRVRGTLKCSTRALRRGCNAPRYPSSSRWGGRKLGSAGRGVDVSRSVCLVWLM